MYRELYVEVPVPPRSVRALRPPVREPHGLGRRRCCHPVPCCAPSPSCSVAAVRESHMDTAIMNRVPSIRAGLLCAVLCSCSMEHDVLQFAGIHEGDYLRGPQVTTLEISDLDTVERAALYIDGARVAADEFAPFALAWNAGDFSEGSHRLMARIELADGSARDRAIGIEIDNTPPTLGVLPPSVAVDDYLELDVADNAKVARVEIASDVTGASPIVLDKPPYHVSWRWGCGAVSLSVRVVDAAGSEATRSAVVLGLDAKDQDCDSHQSIAYGGDDCDDRDAGIYPGALEQRDLVDRNCNQIVGLLEGVDADGDGVASVASGGTDCDDSDPKIHGGVVGFTDQPIIVNSQPVTWNPGEAVLSGDLNPELFLTRAGVVEHVLFQDGRTIALEPVASSANPRSLGVMGNQAAFGRGNQVVIVARDASQQWTQRAVLDGGANIGQLAYDRSGGYDRLVYQAGTEVWFASNQTGAWVQKLAVDTHESLVQAPVTEPGYTTKVMLRTAHAAWVVSVQELSVDPSILVQSIGPAADATPSAIATNGGDALVAVDFLTHGDIYRVGSAPPVLTVPAHVTGMFEDGSYLYVQTEEGVLQMYDENHGLRLVTQIFGVGAFEVAGYDTFVGTGHIYRKDYRSVMPAYDTAGDGVDSNCNGLDD